MHLCPAQPTPIDAPLAWPALVASYKWQRDQFGQHLGTGSLTIQTEFLSTMHGENHPHACMHGCEYCMYHTHTHTHTHRDQVEWGVEQERIARDKVKENSSQLVLGPERGTLMYTNAQ